MGGLTGAKSPGLSSAKRQRVAADFYTGFTRVLWEHVSSSWIKIASDRSGVSVGILEETAGGSA
jgi:hypothetical protein